MLWAVLAECKGGERTATEQRGLLQQGLQQKAVSKLPLLHACALKSPNLLIGRRMQLKMCRFRSKREARGSRLGATALRCGEGGAACSKNLASS